MLPIGKGFLVGVAPVEAGFIELSKVCRAKGAFMCPLVMIGLGPRQSI